MPVTELPLSDMPRPVGVNTGEVAPPPSVKFMLEIDCPAQTAWSFCAPAAKAKVALGLTVIVVTAVGLPTQPLSVGVAVIVTVAAEPEVFAVVNDGIDDPEPLVGDKPIDGVVGALVHVNVAPAGTDTKLIVLLASPAHFVCAGTVLTVGVGLAFTMISSHFSQLASVGFDLSTTFI